MKLTKAFLVKLSEQAGIAALVAFAGTLASTDGSVTKSLITAAVTAALRAAYGVAVSDIGEPDAPQVK